MGGHFGIGRREGIARILPEVVRILNGPEHMSFYLGNGKDGTVFRLFDPNDRDSLAFDDLAIKMWNPAFRSRSQELLLQRMARNSADDSYRTPEVVHEDLELGCFVMERVHGETASVAITRRGQFLSESVFDGILQGFRGLNRGGVRHNDPHMGNYMLSDVQTVQGPDGPIIISADLWIIDFSRARDFTGGHDDLDFLESDLRRRVVPDP